MAKYESTEAWDALLPEERVWIAEHLIRCGECGHLVFIHEHEQLGEVTVCDVENCDCEDHYGG